VDVKSLDVATWCQNYTGHKCHSGPYIQWTFRAGQNVTRTFRRGTVLGFFSPKRRYVIEGVGQQRSDYCKKVFMNDLALMTKRNF
jgi:hypothetical protein